MKILLNISNRLLREALYHYLSNNKIEASIFVVDGIEMGSLRPDIILTDFRGLNSEYNIRYPEAKLVLIDTGLKQEHIIAALVSHKLSGVISTDTDIKLFKKALKVINEGQIWLDNTLIKLFMSNITVTKKGIISLSPKEKEIIQFVCQGYTNKEIASRLSLSDQTVKAHLNRIFKKLNLSNRSQLISFFLNHFHI